MLLAIDIGNSNVVFGLYNGDTWQGVWRLNSLREYSAQYFQMRLSQSLLENDIDLPEVNTIVLSSVVPDLTEKFISFLKAIGSAELILLDRKIYDRLPVKTINPIEMGTDIMANALAAFAMGPADTIIVDFGTALTFTVLRANGLIEGVNIVPGIKTAIRSLSANAAQLHDVPISRPASVLGKTTVEAIQNGVLIGYTGLVEKMILTIETAYGIKFKTIATGGLSSVLPELQFDMVDKNLTINGLKWIGENLR